MTNEQWDFEQSFGAQAEYEAQMEHDAQMAFFEYLGGLLADKQYKLHAIEIVLEMLNSQHFTKSGLAAKDYLEAERKNLTK